MQPTMPFLSETRDLLLVLAVAAAIAGGTAMTAGVTMLGEGPPPLHAPAVAPGPSPPDLTPRLAPAACDCDDPGRLPTALPPTTGRLLSPQSAALSAQTPAWTGAPEAGSFAAWTRAEADPRQILAKLAALARNANRSRAADPDFGSATPDLR